MDFFYDFSYLAKGNPRQRQAFQVLSDLKIFDELVDYEPLLAGTIPIEIEIESSDLDIVCCVEDLDAFSEKIQGLYGHHSDFSFQLINVRSVKSFVANFNYGSFPIEIFAQAIPSHQQFAFLHMLKEYEILQFYGKDFRKQVIQLKKQGIKTEAAFCQILGLKGDPYEAILEWESNS